MGLQGLIRMQEPDKGEIIAEKDKSCQAKISIVRKIFFIIRHLLGFIQLRQ